MDTAIIHIALSLIWALKNNHIPSEKSTKFLGTSSEGFFPTPFYRISHRIHIIRNIFQLTSYQISDVLLLFEVVYWLCSLKFVYPTINLFFRGDNSEIKLPANFCLYSFELFCLQISDAKYFFLSCPRHCDQ